MGAAMSASGFPAQGSSLPSNFDVYEPLPAAPSALTPSVESLIPAGVASNFNVWLFGPGPGVYLDFATLSFQVPIQLSAARAMEPERSITEHREPTSRLLRMSDLLQGIYFGKRNDSVVLRSGKQAGT